MTTEQWAAVVGFVLPAAVSVVNREPWAPWIKAVVALLTSVVGGTVTALLAGKFTGATWIQDIGISFLASQTFYMLWWKKSGITDWIEKNINVLAGKGLPPEPELGGAPGDSGGAVTFTAGRHSVDGE